MTQQFTPEATIECHKGYGAKVFHNAPQMARTVKDVPQVTRATYLNRVSVANNRLRGLVESQNEFFNRVEKTPSQPTTTGQGLVGAATNSFETELDALNFLLNELEILTDRLNNIA